MSPLSELTLALLGQQPAASVATTAGRSPAIVRCACKTSSPVGRDTTRP
jgi:hypothetical protein